MTTIVDVKGLNCPLPVLRVKKAIRDVPAGGMLTVIATDAGAVGDLGVFCEQGGHDLIEWKEESGVFTFSIRKASPG